MGVGEGGVRQGKIVNELVRSGFEEVSGERCEKINWRVIEESPEC